MPPRDKRCGIFHFINRGEIVSKFPIAQFKKRSNVMQAGKEADPAPDLSERIRA